MFHRIKKSFTQKKRPSKIEGLFYIFCSDYPNETSPASLIAMIERQPEHLNLPDFMALNFLLHTGHEIIRGNTELSEAPAPLEKYAIASSAVFLILKN